MHTQHTLRTSAFKQVDVFTANPMYGNALAVIFDTEGLSTEDMQRIAAWTNLSETTFVLAPTSSEADYRVRIFTPRSELPFAGHPSVGTAHALIESERIAVKSKLVQECAAGLLPIEVTGTGVEQRIFVRAPKATMRTAERDVTAELTQALGASPTMPATVVNNGPDWLLVDLGSENVVRRLNADMTAIARLSDVAIGVAVFGRAKNAGYALAVRAFAPADGVPEDPVTGSANAAIGAFLLANGGLKEVGASYRASQGREIGRDGYVDVRVEENTGEVWIGGQTVTCVDGLLALPHA
ncbi:MAG TPA: PhzF family phenazine biosynthesis protein [Rudaea sp.]|jgi:PhzF family phenazine biosynthesis protein|nr:PhzF family phenazine biosynthesis protein [Rudaea sp.]